MPTIAGTFAAIFSLLGSKKWIIRLGRAGTSRTGAGAPTARGPKKSLGERMEPDASSARAGGVMRQFTP
ncbi:hypothetical protein GCM10011314_10290 [Knoellia flava]|uniref:Uncharacterized protein n=1 Tax=Knoellia flava TaxID=913969 RepID=A0A8H9FQT2_9MICO|nr:hypothetical protein GCM10011314_10290 [Knoellia flava]